MHHNNVNQFFYGPLDARQAHFGIGGTDPAQARRRAVGRLDAEEADALLASYVPPSCFDEAVHALQRDRVVVLVGPPGSGKRSGAVALLKEVADGMEYVMLSPDRSLEELAGRPTFAPGVGYVLLDRTNEGPSETADFDWRRVRDKVCEQGAHLVVTTVHEVEGERLESVRHVPWRAPEPSDVIRLRLRKAGCDEVTVKEAVELLPAGCTITEVVAAADRIAQGADAAGVWKEYGSGAARPVRDWFAAERSLQEIAEVTTLVFATGLGLRDFESCQQLLEPHLAPAFPHPPPAGPEAADIVDGTAAPRRAADRRRSLIRNDLAATQEQKLGSLTRTVLVFGAPQYRQWVLEELWVNHSMSYWNGVRDWLTALVGAEPDPYLQLSIASGLTLLARPAFDEVADCYLRPWAQGVAGMRGQGMATLVLCCMSLDEDLGATALTLARSWAQSGDRGLRSTAARAFGGQLGVRFPTDAVKWLWHLTSRGDGQSNEAMGALADLVVALAESREDPSVVFWALAHRLSVQRGTTVATRLKETTFDTVMAVLTAHDLRSGRPVCAGLVARQPQLTEKLGELWAGVLCNRPRRAKALRALRTTLRAVPATGVRPEPVAERFGKAVGGALPMHERPLLTAALRAVRAQPDEAALVEIFLNAVMGTAVLSTKD
ncbi:hypothetical protein ABT173_34365 [Streptomyces sp. NPDC001795]|uniref:nSTAND3 domain-containing NTPase n=1 Tax=unclassified Streptomyces TaxID=2593676 RepID=UPI003330C8B7